MSKSTKLVCLLATPRSGSSYLCDLLEHHPDVESHSELFHRQATYFGIPHRPRLESHFGQELRSELEDYRDERLVQYVHRRPADFLKSLRDQSSKSALFFKLFPRHLEFDTFRELILADVSIGKIIWKREPLAAFVSLKKAIAVKKWSHHDTSGLSVDLSAREFVDWFDANERWYQRCEQAMIAKGSRFESLEYESLMNLGGPLEHLRAITACLANLGAEVGEVPDSIGSQLETRPRQNAPTSPKDSIANLAAFAAELETLGSAGLIRHHLND